MAETTCITPECFDLVFIKKRALCKFHYFEGWRAGDFGHRRVELGWHRLSAIDYAAMTANCSTCGPQSPIAPRKRERAICVAGSRSHTRKWRHGLDHLQVDALIEAAGAKCQICRSEFSESNPPCIDHGHDCCPGKTSCGKCVRGVLCRSCNVGIGMLHDSPDLIASALCYLESDFPAS